MSKHYFLKVVCIVFLPLEIATLYFIYHEKHDSINDFYTTYDTRYLEKIQLKKEYIRETFIPIINDARYLSSKPSIRHFLDTNYRKALENDIRIYAYSSPNYHQIRLLDTLGNEVVRINNQEQKVTVVPSSALQNKSTRTYFLKSKALLQNEIYLSSLDLNIENGQVEKPLRPTLRVVIPVYQHLVKQGMLIVNFDAGNLLQKLNEIDKEEGVSFFLLNETGHFLSADEGVEKFGFALNYPNENFQKYFPKASEALFQKELKKAATEKGLFYSSSIHLIEEIAMNNKFAAKLTGDSNRWEIVYHINAPHLAKQLQKYNRSFLLYAILGTVANLLIAVVFALMRKKEKVFIKELLALNTSLDDKVQERTEQLTTTKIKLEEKVQDLLSSIRYAKKVQETILPQTRIIKSYFPQSFILFLPKDIVAGDFYWMETVDNSNEVLFAVADCTGHGVPGAMVSIVCYNALNKAVKNEKLSNPSLILNRVAELVEQSFSKGEEDDLNDGMDVSLCKINFEKRTLEWAGANNPLWIVRKKSGSIDSEIIEIKPDRQPIGKFEGKRKPFKNHEISLEKEDTIYMMTDGFQDQFNADSTQKLKRVRMKQLIQKVNELEDLATQRDYLISFLKEWRGNTTQIDDICVVGLKL